ncbi:MAG: hypothetical protein IT183_05720 [Acidobacteria bacterium]|nr:hypothetical protein [Acidobacteriota bacterium]
MANSTNITLSDDNLLAEYVPLDKFKGVLQQRFAVGPDLLALLIRDGQIAAAGPGGHFAVGGIWQTLKDSIGGSHAIRLLIADLKPFQLTTSATSLTKNNVPVVGEFTIELQVNPEKPANVLGFMKEHAAVTKASVLNRLTPHLGDRVLNAAIRRVDALELRGNVGLQDKIQADAMAEVERVASDIGFIARVVSLRWGFNEEEKAEILKRQQEREQEILEREFAILNRSIEREAETTVLRLKTDLNVEKAKVATEDDLRRLILSNELQFIDARESGVREQELKALHHELHKNREQRLDALKAQLEAEQHAIEMARAGIGRQDVLREGDTKAKRHDVDVTRIGGEKRDVELDIVRRERLHDEAVANIRADIRKVERSIEEADKKQALDLARLEEMQNQDLSLRGHEGKIKIIRDLNEADDEVKDRDVDRRNRAADAEHRRKIEEQQLATQTELEKLRLLKDGTPEQILAITAGFSPQVANVLVEQAKAKAAQGTELMTAMREMVQMAKDQNVQNLEQAKFMATKATEGAIGVAYGAGAGAGAAGRPAAGGPHLAPGTTECPECHEIIPASDRFCLKCGRKMRQ